METTTLSSKGQVTIPKPIRAAQNWNSGQEFEVHVTAEGVLFRPKAIFAASTPDDLLAFAKPGQKAKTQAEIDAAMKQAARRAWRDRA